LAAKYHGKEASVYSKIPSIGLFEKPPGWALRSTTSSSYMYRHRELKLENQQLIVSSKTEMKNATPYPLAAVASGLGPDGDREKRRRLLKRKFLKSSAIIVGIVAISIGLCINNRDTIMVGLVSSFSRDHTISNTMELLNNEMKDDYDIVKDHRTHEGHDEIDTYNGHDNDDSSQMRNTPATFARKIAQLLAREAEVVIL
jgi:hypothetical protein